MGKGRHTQDKLYITAKEWGTEYGGHRAKQGRSGTRTLPFTHCALSLGPFEHPVMTADGSVFELTQMLVCSCAGTATGSNVLFAYK